MLTELTLKNAKGTGKAYKLYDRAGLYVMVTAAGYRSWRYKYTVERKEKNLVLGSYPAMSLREAREMADDLTKLRRSGRDPVRETKRRSLVGRSSEVTFESLARQWHDRQKGRWREVHSSDVLSSLERDIFPDLGSFPLSDIDPPLLLAVLQKVEKRGAIETAHRLRQRCEAVFTLGISQGVAASNPATGLGPALLQKPIQKRWPAILNFSDLHLCLRATDTAGASPIVRAAARMLALTAQRPGMIRKMQWSHIVGIDWNDLASDTDGAAWIIPAERMKLTAEQRVDDNYDHHVPLVPAAVELLRHLRAMTGAGDYVFWSSIRSRDPMSENALSYLYKRLGYQNRHVPHGWRSSFSSLLTRHYADEPALDVSWERLIDIMIGHVPEGISSSQLRYMREKFAPRRRIIAEKWAVLLLENACPAERVVTGPRRSEPR